MLSAASALFSRLAFSEAISRRDAATHAIVAILHVAALVIMAATEVDLLAKIAFLLAWAALNFFWLAVLRRPAIAALLSLAMFVALILLSQFKHDKLMMTVNFVDLMIIDQDTSMFLLTIMPRLRWPICARRGDRGSAGCPDLASRSVPRAHAQRRRRRHILPERYRCAVAIVSERFLWPVLQRRLCVEICPLRSGGDLRAGDARAVGIRRNRHQPTEISACGRLQPGRKAPAHHPAAR